MPLIRAEKTGHLILLQRLTRRDELANRTGWFARPPWQPMGNRVPDESSRQAMDNPQAVADVRKDVH